MECTLRYCWDKKIERVKEYYGENFTCIITGIMSNKVMNICGHYKYERDPVENSYGNDDVQNSSSAFNNSALINNLGMGWYDLSKVLSNFVTRFGRICMVTQFVTLLGTTCTTASAP